MRTSRVLIFALAAAAACSRGPLRDPQQVTARLVGETLPLEDPAAPLWSAATEHPARLMVQDVAEPRLTAPGVELVAVRALHNTDWLVFRLEWEDRTKDLIPESGRSSDAAAVQFPLARGADVPDAAMGERGKPVRIWYWKALWQDDAERASSGKDRIAALYPNLSIDHYPYAAVMPAARAEAERRYRPAAAASNPVTVRPNTGPVQVLLAEGYGSTTVAPAQPARGRGVWGSGRWVATIARPIRAGAELGDLDVGSKAYVAFAVWDGTARHAGSRKMRSGWIPLVLEAPAP